MDRPNYPTFHCHPQSLDSASTPEAFVERELELGTGYVTATDHGSLVACRKLYDLAHQKGITPILGLEAYLRDDNCEILAAAGFSKNKTGAYIGACKYSHVTLHSLDQAAYECGVRLLSAADARLDDVIATLEPDDRKHGSERKPLFTWNDFEELGSHNVTMGSSCLVGAVARHILDRNDLATARKYYEKLRSCVKPGNFYVEVFPHDCSKNWVEGVFIEVLGDDGQEYKYRWYSGKKVRTDKSEVQVDALARNFKGGEHTRLLAVNNRRKWDDLPPGRLTKVEHRAEYVQNECRPWALDGDIQNGLNRVMIALARKYGDPVVCSDDSHFATPDEQVVQNVRLGQAGGSWRMFGSYHRKDGAESFEYFKAKLGTSEAEFDGWVENNQAWASRFKDFRFENQPSLPTKFYEVKYPAAPWFETTDPKDHSLRYTMDLIRKHGRMDWGNKAYVDRLATEISLLHNNGTIDLLPYWFIDEEACSFFEEQGKITGPGRGSAAGVLLTYLLGVTHVDPLRYGLSLERFITLDRIRSGRHPDIDQDLPQKDRGLLLDPETGWLQKRFGDHYAQLSVDVTLKARAAVKDVARFTFGHVPADIEALTKRFEMPPQGVKDIDFLLGYDSDAGHVQGSIERDPALIDYVTTYPDQWNTVQKALGLMRQRGRHACSFLVSNRPVSSFIPLTTVGGVRVTSYTASSVEAVGGLKMDFLGLGCLDDIGDAVQLVQARHPITHQHQIIEHEENSIGWSGTKVSPKRVSIVLNGKRVPSQRLLPVNNELHDIWDLPADQKVFADIACGRTETVFQFSTPGAVKWLEHFSYRKANGNYAIDSIESMAAFTALDRPGPLDIDVTEPGSGRKHNMLVEYARRARGETPSPDILPIFDELLPETHGVLCFQENLQQMYQELTGCSRSDAEEFRSDVAKKKKAKIDKAYLPFLEKAGAKLGNDNAKAAWSTIVTWAKYGFCIDGTQQIRTSGGPVAISELTTKDEVATDSGFEHPLRVWKTGDKEVLEVTLEDGTTISSTADHQFWHRGDWMTLFSLIRLGWVDVFRATNKIFFTCECGQRVSTNTLKTHLKGKKCTASRTFKKRTMSVCELRTQPGHKWGWLRSEGLEGEHQVDWWLSILAGTTTLTDWTFEAPRPSGTMRPSTCARNSEERKGRGNPVAKKHMPSFTTGEVIAYAQSLLPRFGCSDFTGLAQWHKEIKVHFPYYPLLFSDGHADGGLPFSLRRFFDLCSGLTREESAQFLALARGKHISRGQLSSPSFLEMARKQAAKLVCGWRITIPHRVLFEMVRTLDPDAELESRREWGSRTVSYDIFSPLLDAFIEMHGVIWHSRQPSHNPKMAALVEKNLKNDRFKAAVADRHGYLYFALWDADFRQWESQLEHLYGRKPGITLEEAEDRIGKIARNAARLRHGDGVGAFPLSQWRKGS